MVAVTQHRVVLQRINTTNLMINISAIFIIYSTQIPKKISLKHSPAFARGHKGFPLATV